METKKLILLIDDEPDFLVTMRFFLENSNFRTITASSPEEGLEKARLKPDLILLDLIMPGMDGHEVCRRLKEDSTTLFIPIIMLTSHDKTLDKVEALNLGVADYIGKHFPFEEILARIKAVLREKTIALSLEAIQERNKKILELRRIIDEVNLRILFQPIVELPTRQPIGYEAFTHGPKGSFLENAVDLFSLANEANMFYELDKLCLSLAIKKASFIPSEQLLFLNTDPTVIDKQYFRNLNFLEDYPVRPSRICLEITERTCITNFSRLSDDLNYLRSLGIRVAIDDVGEGYASLKAIAELKPEFIKIDISLVRNVDSDGVKNNLVQFIVNLGKKINSCLIAEGIETEEEYNMLLFLGVDYGQGYLFARPFEQA